MELDRLKGYTGRVLRDIERQMDKVAEGPPKSTTGDALFAVLCGCGHNIRMIQRHLRIFVGQFTWLIKLRRGFTRRR